MQVQFGEGRKRNEKESFDYDTLRAIKPRREDPQVKHWGTRGINFLSGFTPQNGRGFLCWAEKGKRPTMTLRT